MAERHTAERAAIVSAEAGYGKTTLLADFARRTDRPRSGTGWKRATGTGARFWATSLPRSARPSLSSAPPPPISWLKSRRWAPPWTSQSAHSWRSSTSCTAIASLLILDDFHLVQESQDVQAILERMFELAPEDMAFVLAGRRSPERRLARLERAARWPP